MGGMVANLLDSHRWLVGLFPVEGDTMVRDPVQLEAQGTGLAQPQGSQAFNREIPAEVAVEFPVLGWPGYPSLADQTGRVALLSRPKKATPLRLQIGAYTPYRGRGRAWRRPWASRTA